MNCLSDQLQQNHQSGKGDVNEAQLCLGSTLPYFHCLELTWNCFALAKVSTRYYFWYHLG